MYGENLRVFFSKKFQLQKMKLLFDWKMVDINVRDDIILVRLSNRETTHKA